MNDKDTVARPVKQLTLLINVTRGRWRRVLRGDFKTGVMWRRVGWVWHWLGVPYRELGGLATGGVSLRYQEERGRRCVFVLDGLRGMSLYMCGLAWSQKRRGRSRWAGKCDVMAWLFLIFYV